MKELEKRKKRRGGILSLFVIITMFLFTACSQAVEDTNEGTSDIKVTEATSDFYVNDFAGILSETQKSEMMTRAINLDENYSGIQVVVTTTDSLAECVDSNKEYTIEQIAYAMYNQYGVGKDDMGILILFSEGDRKIYLSTGRNMQVYITDSKSGQLLDDYGMEYFKADQFAEGLDVLQEAVIEEIKESVPSDWNDEKTALIENSTETKKSNETPTKKEKENPIMFVVIGIFAVVLMLASIILLVYSSKKRLMEKDKEHSKEITELKKRIQILKDSNEKEKSDLMESHQSVLVKLKDEMGQLENENRALSTALEELEEKYERIKKLHPENDFEAEIKEMIECECKEKAHEIDLEIAEMVKEEKADKDSVDLFRKAIQYYESTESSVKKYLKTDIEKIRDLYEESLRLLQEFERIEQEKRDKKKAKEVYDFMKETYLKNPVGNYDSYPALKKAYQKYRSLTTDQKKFFPESQLIQTMENILRVAKEDYENYQTAKEAEEEVSSVVGRIYDPEENDLDDLERAIRRYKRLSTVQQAYFDVDLIRRAVRMKEEAEEDHRRRERMRHEAHYHNSHNNHFGGGGFSGGSSFGGHGGRSSGGGAGRSF